MLIGQLTSLAIFIVLFIAWVIPIKLDEKETMPFRVLIGSTAVYLLFDLLVSYSFIINLPFRNFLFKVFMSILLFRCFFEFSYLSIKANKNHKREKSIMFAFAIPVIGSILTLILPIHTETLDNGGLLVDGPSISVAYLTAFIIFILMIVYLIANRKSINKWNRVCFVTTLLMWGAGVVVQIFVDQTGILDVAFVCTLCAMFAFFENPLNYRNHEYDCIKDNYIGKYIDLLLSRDSNAFVFSIDILSLNSSKENYQSIFNFKKELIDKLKEFKDLRVFLYVENEIIVIGTKVDKFDYYNNFIKEEIDKYYLSIDFKMHFRSEIIYSRDIKLFANSNEYIMRLSYAKNEIKSIIDRNAVYEINLERLKAIEEEERVKEEIKDALAEDRVEAFVQPIYSVKRKKFISCEALCRIRKHDGSIMLPYQFIPISEKCGLDIPIGYRMIEKVCQILSSSIYGSLFESIDVNLSIGECESENLPSRIINIIQKYNIDPKRINFEITESGFINRMSVIKANIKILTDYGFGFSLDDFGNGESNLDYLVKLPVDYLKLDMSMIWAYFKNDNAKKTLLSIFKIAHEMNLKVVAEGVETKEQFEELEQRGIDFIQGYYFYKPMSIIDYDNSLKKA